MHFPAVLIVFSSLILISNCDITLQIIRNTEENYTPVENAVSEKAGTNLTLSCELLSDVNDNHIIDDQITWEKASSQISLKSRHDLEQLTKSTKTYYSLVKPSDTNKAVKNFLPLKLEDTGMYFCISFKYKQFKSVYINVGNDTKLRSYKGGFNFPIAEECSSKMFQCTVNGVCINQIYVCDGRKDCPDGSDESVEKCNGDPCLDKLPCEDGRCIPHYWCCDRHHDPNCNVTYRPTCCQQLSDPYDELEYGYVPYNMTQEKAPGSRYLFISFCILATILAIILMILIVSKIFIFTNKTACGHPRSNVSQLDDLTCRQYRNDLTPFRTNFLGGAYRNRLILSNVRYVGNCDDVLEPVGEVSDPLLSPGSPPGRNLCRTYAQEEQPPSYSEVVQGQCEPPPPYTSRECLNIHEERQTPAV